MAALPHHIGAAPKPDRLIVIEQGNTTEAIALAEEAIAPLLRNDPFPSAIFACNDLMADRGATWRPNC